MRIAIIADPYIPVPPDKYGGIERIIAMLIENYVAQGHRVTLFAHPDSMVDCELVHYGIPPHKGHIKRLREILQIWQKLAPRKNDFDIIHSFGRLIGLLPLYFSKVPKVQSYQRPINWLNIFLASRLAGKGLFFTALSDNCRRYGHLPGRWMTIYNGVSINKYRFEPRVAKDAPLVFLGRMERIKGVHTAIEVARRTGNRLIIAGNHSALPHDAEYWKRYILPQIGKEGIEYIGPVNDAQKNDLLGRAAALLMPIEWEEPFGIVMAEALACGTPVIAFRRGAVSEVVEDGVNGFVCESKDAMVAAVKKIGSIQRTTCRNVAEQKFSDKVIVGQYLSLYNSLVRAK